MADLVSVRLVRPYRGPDGSFLNRGESIGVSEPHARAIVAAGVGVLTVAEDAPDVDKMVSRAVRKARS